MQLDLVDHGERFRFVAQPLDVVRLEVAHADRAGASVFVQRLQGVPRFDEFVLRRRRPVDEVQVDVVHPELVEAVIEGEEGFVVAVSVVPDLRGDEDLLARYAARPHPSADAALVGIQGSRVDVPVASTDGTLDELCGEGIGHLVHPETELRDAAAIVEGKHR